MVRVISTANLGHARECYYDPQVDGVVYEEDLSIRPERVVPPLLQYIEKRYCPQIDHIDLGDELEHTEL
jgi:hypothetical protein